MNSILLALTAVLIVVLSALFAAPYVVDWNAYRPVFETQASKLLGRDVKVHGNVHLVLLPAPQLRFDDVRVADSKGAFDRPFLEASSIEAWLNVGALIRGTFEARKIIMADPVLRLALREDGTGNWQDVGRPGEALPFAPKEVLLDEVSVNNGRIELVRPGKEPLLLEAVNGVASASSLSGPYKLRANYRYADRPQEVRFSTAVADANGKFRAKAVMRDLDPGLSYILDGDVTGLNAKPNYDGTVVIRTANQVMPSAPVSQPVEQFVEEDIAAPPAAAPKDAEPSAQLSAWELKGDLKANPDSAELPSFEVTIHQKGRSQMLKGELAIAFGEQPKTEASLQARWLDADALLAEANQGELTTLSALNEVAGLLLEHAAELGTTSLSVALEQASLGGDMLGGVNFALRSEDGNVSIEQFSASLPGENRIEASGRVTATEKGPAFEGPIKLSGSKLRTFVRWAAGDRDLSGQTAVGAFSLSGQLRAGGGDFELKDAKGEVSGTLFAGSLHYVGGEQRLIDIAFDSDRLDLREVLGEKFSWATWLPASAQKPEQTAVSSEDLFGPLRDDEVKAKLRIGELLLPDIPQGKLDARFIIAKDTLNVEGLEFSSPGALSLTGKGRIEGLSTTPTGQIDFSFRAVNAESLGAAATLLGYADDKEDAKQIAGLAPLDVTGVISAASRGGATEASGNIAGTAGGSAVTVQAKMNGDVGKLADASIGIEGSVDGDRPQALLGVFFPGLAESRLSRVGAGKGKLTFKLDGVPSQRLTGTAALGTAALQARFDGEGSLRDDGLALTGRATAKSNNAALPLQILGLNTSPSAAEVPLELEAEIVKAGPRIELKSITGKVAGEAFEASGYFDVAEKTRFSLDGTAKSVSLPALLGALVAWERPPGAENLLGSIGQGASDVWPARGFALDVLAASEGDIKLRAERLSLGAPFQIEGAELIAKVDAEGLALSELKGTLFGGTLLGSGRLSPRGAGAELKLQVGIEQAQLGPMTEALAGSVLAEGPFSLKLALSGEGLSPPGIVAGLSGEGVLNLAQGSLQSLSPEPLHNVASEAARLRKLGLGKEEIAARAKTLSEALTSGTYPYAAAALPLKVQNGTLRLEPAQLVNQRAETTVNGYVELASLKVDSEWIMRLNGQNADVPPVSLVFAGPLTNVAGISRSVDTAPIESFLTMRRMEDDVERLERLDVTGRRKPEPEPISHEPSNQEPQLPAPAEGTAETQPSAEPVEAAPAPADAPGSATPEQAAVPPAVPGEMDTPQQADAPDEAATPEQATAPTAPIDAGTPGQAVATPEQATAPDPPLPSSPRRRVRLP